MTGWEIGRAPGGGDDLLGRIQEEIRERMAQLAPLVREAEALEAELDRLALPQRPRLERPPSAPVSPPGPGAPRSAGAAAGRG